MAVGVIKIKDTRENNQATCDRTEPDRTKPNQTEPDRTRPNQKSPPSPVFGQHNLAHFFLRFFFFPPLLPVLAGWAAVADAGDPAATTAAAPPSPPAPAPAAPLPVPGLLPLAAAAAAAVLGEAVALAGVVGVAAAAAVPFAGAAVALFPGGGCCPLRTAAAAPGLAPSLVPPPAADFALMASMAFRTCCA